MKSKNKIVKEYENAIEKNKEVYFDIDDYLLIISYYLDNNLFSLGLNACNNALQFFPESIDIKYIKITFLMLLNKKHNALVLIDELINLEPHRIDYLIKKGTIYYLMEDYKSSIDWFKNILNEKNDKSQKADILCHIGICYISLKQHQKANLYFDKALNINPNHFLTLSKKGLLCKDFEDYDLSIKCFEKCTELDPYNKEIWNHLGQTYHQNNQLTKAIECFEYALAIDEKYTDAHLNLGRVMIDKGDYSVALNHFLNVLKYEGPSITVFYCFASTYEISGNWDLAIQYYKKILNINENLSDIWYRLGCVLQKLNKYYEAISHFQKAIKLNPKNDNPNYYKHLAQSENKLGNLVSAIEAYKIACELNPKDASNWLEISYIFYEQNHYNEALEWIETALDEVPNHASLLYRKVLYLLATRQYKEALNSLEIALSNDYYSHYELTDLLDENQKKGLMEIIEKYNPLK